MWDALHDIANRLQVTIHDLVTRIDREREASSLTAAIRVYLVDFYRAAALKADSGSSTHRAAQPGVSAP